MNTLLDQTTKPTRNQKDTLPGSFPARIDTVRAATLAALLNGERLTGLDSVYQHSTTRLSAVICDAIEKKYNWPVNHTDLTVSTSDGRQVTVTEYWLAPATIALAFELGGRQWAKEVKAARATLKKYAAMCPASLPKNSARRPPMRASDPRQLNLWG